MKKRLSFLFVTLMMLTSCTLIGENEEDGFTGGEYVPPEGAPLAPMLLDEDMSCTHFVSPAGDDSSPGSETDPWASFQMAVDSVNAGDTVCFRGGTYRLDDIVQINKSGTAEEPIILIAYPGERPILDGGKEVGGMIVFMQYASYFRLSGFTLQNFNIWGIEVSGGNSYLHFDHLEIIGGESSIHFTYGESSESPPAEGPVDHMTVEDSLIHGSMYSAVDCTPGPCNHMIVRRVEVYGTGLTGEDSYGADGIEFARGYPVLIEDCFVHDNGGDGIDLNSRDRAGHAIGVIARRNKVIRNHLNGIKLWAGGLIENNIIWGNGDSAVWIGTWDCDLEVINNTIAYNAWDPSFSQRNWTFSAGYPEELPRPEVNLLLANNIFAFNTGPEISEPTGIYLGPGVNLTENHNLYFSRVDGEITAEFLGREFTRQELADGSWANSTGQGEGILVVDPMFVSGWPEVDLNLMPSSPAINAGDNDVCPDVDALGNPRSHSAEDGCDLGALEWSE